MCVPTGRHRKNQLEVQKKVPARNPQTLHTTCNLRQSEEAAPTLLKLEVTGARPLRGGRYGRYWALKDDLAKVRVKAITEPSDTPVAWTGGTATENPMIHEVDRSKVAVVRVKATLDCDKSVTIEIYDLVSVSCPLPLKDGKHKAYRSDATTLLTAVTSPDEKRVWDLLKWSEGTAGDNRNVRDVALTPVGDRAVTVSLGSKTLSTPLHICQWPRLQIMEVLFECHDVLNDGVTEIGKKFDKKWKRGRADPAAKQKTSESQAPLCFTRKTKVTLAARFEVTEIATETETVKVKANLGFGEIAADVTVTAGRRRASMAPTESTAALPDRVDRVPAWNIAWTAVLEDSATWVDAGTSTSPLYVLLGDPQKSVYLTLLDVSCESARGKSTADDVVAESFKPFAAAKGTGNGFVRRGDGLSMSYYKDGSDTPGGNDMQTTDGLLSNGDATGRCGGWSTLLRHMWAMHGITATSERWYIRSDHKNLMNPNLRFLVKHCAFSATGSTPAEPYTHDGSEAAKEVLKEDGLPGHGQDNPQFDFADHVVVKYGGKYYDPSYGVGPYDTDEDYLSAALDGLGKYPKIEFNFKGIPQQIPRHCVRYKDGFAEHTIVKNPFDFFALVFQVPGSALFPDCTIDPPRASVADVQSGDIVRVWDKGVCIHADRMGPLMSLADIASKYALSEDVIFDHAKNGALKALRKNKASLETGDTVVVPFDLSPAGKRVTGYDLP